MGKSQWEQVYLFLKEKGFSIFSPGQKIGKCTEPYIVLKYDGAVQHMTYSTDDDIYTILCYVPKLKYSLLDGLIQSVRKAMKEFHPQLIITGNVSGSVYEEEIEAHVSSIEYRNHKKR
mgnify:CR=1 FL=1|jgi:hypothetical protein